MTRIADSTAQTLYAHGVRHAFGMPGGEIVTLIEAPEKAGIRFVLCRHETAAAITAAGASSVTGVPGLLVTTLGQGLTNAVNGIADALREHVPLIVMSGVVEHGIRGRCTQIEERGATMLVKTSRYAFLDALAKALDRGSETIAVRERLGALFRPPSGWGPHHEFDVLGTFAGRRLITVDSGAHRILISK